MDFIHAETGVEPLKDRLQKNDMVTYERYLRLDETDPRRAMLEKEVEPRLKTRIGWRSTTKPLMKPYDHLKRAPRSKPTAPWITAGIEFEKVELEEKKSLYTEQELREKALKKIEEVKCSDCTQTVQPVGTRRRGEPVSM